MSRVPGLSPGAASPDIKSGSHKRATRETWNGSGVLEKTFFETYVRIASETRAQERTSRDLGRVNARFHKSCSIMEAHRTFLIHEKPGGSGWHKVQSAARLSELFCEKTHSPELAATSSN